MNKIIVLREKRSLGRCFLSVVNNRQAKMLRDLTGKETLDYRDIAGLIPQGFLFVIDSN